MSRQKLSALEKLQEKRNAIDAQIAAAEAAEKRKLDILVMPEFDAILLLPVHEIRTGLKKMVQESVPQKAESGT